MQRIDIEPMGAPRPRVTRHGAFNDEKYTNWKRAVRLLYRGTLPDRVAVTFFVPMPKSWTKKKKAAMLHQPHQQKPDIDNLAKGFLDALRADDERVHFLQASKVWANEGSIKILEL